MKQESRRPSKKPPPTTCSHLGHAHGGAGCRPAADPVALDRASRLFRAMGDAPRLRILQFLSSGESCVTELVEGLGEKFPTVSQRLRVLRTEGLVARRRAGLHVYYSLADRHV